MDLLHCKTYIKQYVNIDKASGLTSNRCYIEAFLTCQMPIKRLQTQVVINEGIEDQAVDFKILLLVYKALNGLGPKYILDLLVPYEASRTLRSSGTGLLCVPKTRTKQGEAAFSYCAPHLWNKLPADLRSAQTVSSFKSGLKTLSFTAAY